MRSTVEGGDPNYLAKGQEERTAAKIARLEARVARLEQQTPATQTTGAPTDIAPIGSPRIDPATGTVYFSRGGGLWRAV